MDRMEKEKDQYIQQLKQLYTIHLCNEAFLY